MATLLLEAALAAPAPDPMNVLFEAPAGAEIPCPINTLSTAPLFNASPVVLLPITIFIEPPEERIFTSPNSLFNFKLSIHEFFQDVINSFTPFALEILPA